jgi:hypothetical protein
VVFRLRVTTRHVSIGNLRGDHSDCGPGGAAVLILQFDAAARRGTLRTFNVRPPRAQSTDAFIRSFKSARLPVLQPPASRSGASPFHSGIGMPYRCQVYS